MCHCTAAMTFAATLVWFGLAAGLGGRAYAQAAVPDDKEYVGNARVIDTDVLEVDGQRFVLYGIDAMEQEQNCFLNGKQWSCGAVAYRELEKIVAEEGGAVTCTPRQDANPRRPATPWGTCVIGGKDIAELMVRRGMAVAVRDQSLDYVAAEKAADMAGIGVWQGPFILPWEYRERLR